MKQFFNFQKGFTLVELLIVIAILGVLAAGLLAVLDPLEQIQRARDATRISQVNQLGNAMTAYFVSQQKYPALNNTWITSLVDAGELKQASPVNVTSLSTSYICGDSPNTDERNQNNFCYAADGTGSTGRAIVFVNIESKTQRIKANCNRVGGVVGAGNTWFVWSSTYGKAGFVCTSGANVGNEGPGLDSQPF